MPTPVETRGRFTFADWEETPVGAPGTPGTPGAPDATPRLAHAHVANTFTGGVEAAGTSCDYTIAYTGENTGSYSGMELLSGSVDGRKGSFVLEERGTFDAGGTVCRFEVVAGSGTGDLVGLTGSGGFTYRHGDTSVEYAFTYALV
ncbi:DUF3224 domain-containing protein [Streptomyces erythrochromogenes]|uniref:DUF3224 domain-containing protein n=1 Tax=Streptomyces erythrochromogenes TaxID=285574 RepID=UPI0002D85FEA